jgi:hypothetical protein
LALVLASGLAAAQSAPSLVVVVAADPASPTARRLSTDLQGIGLDVLVLRATPENSSGHESLERAARSVGAIAAVRLVPSGTGTEVWVADRVTGKTVIRQLVQPSNAEAEPEDVALGAVELLRASLMELHAPSLPHGEVEVTPQVRKLALPGPAPLPASAPPPPPAPLPRFALMVGPGIDFGVRDISPSLQGYWALGVRIAGPMGARAFASLPIVPGDTTIAEGRVEVTTNIVGLGAFYEPGSTDQTFIPSVGLGAAAARIETIGQASAPFLSAADAGWTAGGYVQASAIAAVTSGVRLRLDLTGIVAVDGPDIVANARSLGRWGAPALLVSLGVEVVR